LDNIKALFVINPKSGVKKKLNIPDIIAKTIGTAIDYKIIFWEFKDQDISEIIRNYIKNENYNTVVAVGGDGTVNKIASVLINTNIAFGIIPMGSGNGLARHLKIPLTITKAIQLIIRGKNINIDSCAINNQPFFCTSGIGFDAQVGELFAHTKKRGFINYVKIILSLYKSYKPEEYLLEINDKIINVKAFLITFANANQWGNNAIIAPYADIQDGKINITIIKPFKFYNALAIVFRLYNKTIIHSPFAENYNAQNIKVLKRNSKVIHYDGEPCHADENLTINILPNSLKIIVP